jgi:type I restriction enzyme S subunit
VIEGLKPYPEYKESGLPWLGKFPAHWELIRNRALMQQQREVVGKNSADYTLLSLTLGGIIPRNMETLKGKFPAQFNTYKVVRPEDLVFCLFDIDETPRGIGHSKLNGMITGAYDVFTPKPRANVRYLYLYYLFLDEGKLLKPLYTGLRKTIRPGDFASLKTPCPKTDEQHAIVRFLDHANGRIERAIRAKKKLIALLNEQKQAIIHRAITRGLAANVPLKPSGIAWLGDIPKHWKLVRAKQVAQVFIPQRNKPELNEGEGYPWITPVNVGEAYVCRINLFVTQSALASAGSRALPAGSVVASCIGRFGIASVTEVPVIINQQLQAYIPSQELSANYLRHCVQIARPYFEAIGNSTTLAYVDRQGFGSLPLPFPARDEQETIERFLETEFVGTDQTIAHVQREIALLREYRARLVADVVTGKLDVRATARNLPDTDEPTTSIPDESEDGELIEEEQAV